MLESTFSNRSLISDNIVKKILDFGSGIGNEAFFLAKSLGSTVDCINISEEENKGAEQLLATGEQDVTKNINFITADEDSFKPKEKYDALHLGEVLEHQPCAKTFMEKLHKNLKHEAPVVITVPLGIWQDVRHAHLWNYERQDLEEIGVPGVVLQIFTAGPDGLFGTADDIPGVTQTSDSNGNYLFDGLD